MSQHLTLFVASPLFLPSLDKYLISVSFFISHFGSLFITRLTKVSLTPTCLQIPMKSMAIGLVLQKTKRTNLLGRFPQMIPRGFSSDQLSAVPPTLPPTRDSLCHMGRDKKTDLTSNSFVYDATLSNEDSGLMPTISFDDLLGRMFHLPAQENGKCQ